MGRRISFEDLRTSEPPAPLCGHRLGPLPAHVGGLVLQPSTHLGALDPILGPLTSLGGHFSGLPSLVHSCSSLLFVLHPSSSSSLPCPSLPVLMWGVDRHEYLQQKNVFAGRFSRRLWCLGVWGGAENHTEKHKASAMAMLYFGSIVGWGVRPGLENSYPIVIR